MNLKPSLSAYLKYKAGDSVLSSVLSSQPRIVLYVSRDPPPVPIVIWGDVAFVSEDVRDDDCGQKLITIFSNIARVQQVSKVEQWQGYIHNVVRTFSQTLANVETILRGDPKQKKVLLEKIKVNLDTLVNFLENEIDDELALSTFRSLQNNVNERLGITSIVI